jgi:hypothetical protein
MCADSCRKNSFGVQVQAYTGHVLQQNKFMYGGKNIKNAIDLIVSEFCMNVNSNTNLAFDPQGSGLECPQHFLACRKRRLNGNPY